MHDCDSAPSCCAFTHWVAFEEVYGATREESLERNPQLSLATRGEDGASQGQPKGKADIPVVL